MRGAPFDAFATDKGAGRWPIWLLSRLKRSDVRIWRRSSGPVGRALGAGESAQVALPAASGAGAAAPGLASQALEITHHTVAFRAGAAEVDALTFQSLLAESDAHAHAGLERCPHAGNVWCGRLTSIGAICWPVCRCRRRGRSRNG